MYTSQACVLRTSRRTPLAIGVAAVFGLSMQAAMANLVKVDNCNDSGAGSLRDKIGLMTTMSGDTLDMSKLPCSTISINSGEIVVNQSYLTLMGPSSGVTINGKYNFDIDRSRIFNHQGAGTLSAQNMIIRGGSIYSTTSDMRGGCIYSKGNVYLDHSVVEYCYANAKNHVAAGGGIFALGSVIANNSKISYNLAGFQVSNSAAGEGAYGGAVYALGDFQASYSTISGNTAGQLGPGHSAGGAIHASTSVSLNFSTVSSNEARGNGAIGGGLFVRTSGGSVPMLIDSSTISGNFASSGIAGGMYSNQPLIMRNSTIAFNMAGSGKRSEYHYDAPGLDLVASVSSINANLQSSLISNNFYGSIESDFSIYGSAGKTVTIHGANNLVVNPTFNPPPDVITAYVCPLLGPLRDNGGATQTHALLSHSPAIDAGNDAADLAFDQRGSPYTRIVHGAADIGAYEVQQADIVFNTSFEGCF